MSDINDRLNNTHQEPNTRGDVVEKVTKIVVANFDEVEDGDVLKYDGATGEILAVPASDINAYFAGENVVPIADGGTGASTPSAARTALGLGTISTQEANNVTITGGTITGITDLAVADGGTGASTHTSGNILIGNGTSAITSTAVPLVRSYGGSVSTSLSVPYGVVLGGTTSTNAVQTVSSLGTSGQYLTSNGNSAIPSFNTFSGTLHGSGWHYISTLTGDGILDKFTFTGLSSDYIQYILVGSDVYTNTSSVYPKFTCCTGEAFTEDTSSSNYSLAMREVSSSDSSYEYTSSSDNRLFGYVIPYGSNTNFSFTCLIDNPSNTALYKTLQIRYRGYTPYGAGHATVIYKSISAVTGIAVSITNCSGSFYLYGRKNS